MIFYNPVGGDILNTPIRYRPKTCFLMTKLGNHIPEPIVEIKVALTEILEEFGVSVIDANSIVTGRDFLLKIWTIILSVPLGVAIIDQSMSAQTCSNIFYEIGLMQAYGKEILIIKTKGTEIPSDFVRTEYIEFGDRFNDLIRKFITSFSELSEYYAFIAEQVENDPLLSIDYLRRAFLISNNEEYREKARYILGQAAIHGRAKNSVENLLVSF